MGNCLSGSGQFTRNFRFGPLAHASYAAPALDTTNFHEAAVIGGPILLAARTIEACVEQITHQSDCVARCGPLNPSRPAGDAHADFGEALVVIGGEERK